MAKTVSTGIRFNIEELDGIKKKEGLDTPQQVVNFLMDMYESRKVVTRVDKKGASFMPGDMDKYWDRIKDLEYEEECNKFVKEVEGDETLTPYQKRAIKERLAAKWK